MSSKTGSTTRQAEAVRTAAVVTHGKPSTIGEALPRLERVAAEAGVELLFSEDEAEKHGLDGRGLDRRAHDRARLGSRRRGPRVAPLRRRALRDSLRLDGLQPLERRTGPRL